MAKDTFARTKPHWSLSNSMSSQWFKEVENIDELDADEVLQNVSWTKGKSYPLRAVLDTENSEDNENGTYSVAILFYNNASNLAADQNDEIWILLYNHTTKYIDTKKTNATRADGAASIDVNIPPSGTTYIAFYAASVDSNAVSSETALATLTSEGVLAAIE